MAFQVTFWILEGKECERIQNFIKACCQKQLNFADWFRSINETQPFLLGLCCTITVLHWSHDWQNSFFKQYLKPCSVASKAAHSMPPCFLNANVQASLASFGPWAIWEVLSQHSFLPCTLMSTGYSLWACFLLTLAMFCFLACFSCASASSPSR